MPPDPIPTADGLRALLARRPYAVYLAGRFCGSLATGTQSVVLGWEVYETARQTMSVPEVRGRVAAVSTLFIGASNELGEFESGVVARVLGPVGAVAFGGAGAMAVTALWAWLFPPLRKADRLH